MTATATEQVASVPGGARARRVVTSELAAAARDLGDQVLVRWVDTGATTSYAQMHERAVARARTLAGVGVRRGARVAIMSSDGREFVTNAFAVMYLGAVVTPIGVELRGASLQHPLRLYAPHLLIADDDLLPMARAACAPLDPAPQLVSTAELVAMPTIDVGDEAASALPLANEPADPCLIMSTSGTTGPSKGSSWDHGTLETWAMTYVRALHYTSADCIYCCTPLTHANALVTGVMAAVYARCAVAISPRFSVRQFWSDIRTSGATSANLLGSMIHLLLRVDDVEAAKGSTLRTVLASSCSAASYRQVQQDWGLTAVSAYGLTDFGTLTIADDVEGCPPGSCGRAAGDFELRLVDGNDEDVAPGAVGELIARPRRPWAAPSGYFGMPDATVDSRRNLWFHTGDLLRRDEDGWFYFAGRTKDALRYRGENVSAHEVEQVLLSHSAVVEAAVYAVESPLGEDEIVAAVVASATDVLDLAALTVAISTELPHYSVPRYFRVLPELPKNGSQRVLKQVLSGEGITADTWDRDAMGIVVARNRPRPPR